MARSAVHHRYAALGATFERAHGWDLPVRFPYDDKPRAASAGVVLGDESAIGKFLVQGAGLERHGLGLPPGALPAAGRWVPSDPGGSRPGHLYHPAADRMIFLVPLAHRAEAQEPLARLAAAGAECVHAVDVSASYASFMLGGPDAAEVLAGCATANLGALAAGGVAACGLAGHPCIVGRHARGWRILVGRDEAEDLWELLENAEPDLVVASWDTVREWLW